MSTQNIIYRISALDLLSPVLNKIGISATAASAAVGMVVKGVLDAGTKVQDARTGLTTLLKDANAANTVIERTMKDAANTPFDFDTLLQGNKALISTGISANRARTDILALGNAVAATGGGSDELNRMTQNLQQIRNVGKASAMDIKQFGYAGINMYSLLEKSTGKTVEQLKKVPITYDMITEALQKASEAGGVYEGALDRMGQNVSIKISNIGDNLFIIYNNIFMKSSGFISKVLDGINKILVKIKEFTSNTEKMREFGNIMKDITAAVVLGISAWKLWNGLTYLSTINIEALTTSMWAFVSAESAALLGLPLLIAGFSALIDKGDEFDTHMDATLYRLGYAFGKTINGIIYLYDRVMVGIDKAKENLIKNNQELTDKFDSAFKKSTDKNVKELERYLEAANKIRGRKVDATMTKETEDDKLAMEKQISLLEKAEKQFGKKSDAYQKIKTALDIGDLTKGNDADKTPKTIKQTKNVAGPKITTINITMKNLVGSFKVETTNMKEGANNAKDIVIAALTQALNDSQAIV